MVEETISEVSGIEQRIPINTPGGSPVAVAPHMHIQTQPQPELSSPQPQTELLSPERPQSGRPSIQNSGDGNEGSVSSLPSEGQIMDEDEKENI